MGFTIKYNKLFELAVWHHRWLKTATYDPSSHAYTGAAFTPGDPFVIPLAVPVPTESTRKLLKHDIRSLLEIRPCTGTAKQLENLGLIFKTTTTGFWVVKGDKNPLPSSSNLRFTFTVRLLDPTFIEKTRVIPGWPNGKIFHLTNALANPSTRFLLTKDGTEELLRDVHFFIQKGRIVRIPQSVQGTATTIEVHDDLANPADPPVLSKSFAAIPLQTEYELDCRHLISGRYRLSGPNTTPVTYYLGLEESPNLLGIIDILPQGWVQTLFDVRLADIGP